MRQVYKWLVGNDWFAVAIGDFHRNYCQTPSLNLLLMAHHQIKSGAETSILVIRSVATPSTTSNYKSRSRHYLFSPSEGPRMRLDLQSCFPFHYTSNLRMCCTCICTQSSTVLQHHKVMHNYLHVVILLVRGQTGEISDTTVPLCSHVDPVFHQ